MRKVLWPLFGLLILAMMQPALAARPLGPPVEELLSKPDLTRIAVAVASEKEETTYSLATA